MRKVKQGLAAVLAALLMLPTQPALAGTQMLAQSQVLREAAESGEKEKKASPGNAQEADKEKGEEKADEKTEEKGEEKGEEKTEEKVEEQKEITSKKLENKAAAEKEEIIFNTGRHAYSVVDRDSFFEDGIGDAAFEEDGSYTIMIPEEDPFFPYEVEFTYKGKRERKWFMTPDAQVEIGGHVFYISASFDGDAVTQMSLQIGGDTVIVYPEEKEFTNEDDGGIEPASLLPLEEKSLNVDLTGYTPLELTMVAVDDLFIGGEMADGDKVMWARYSNDYTISSSGDKLDLSYGTCRNYEESWTMIVGKDDQLATDNIRYSVYVKTTPSQEWLIPTVYTQDSEGKRTERTLSDKYLDNNTYYDDGSREFGIAYWKEEQEEKDTSTYVQLEINAELFPEVKYDHIKVYEGEFTSAEEAMAGIEITDKLFAADMTQKDAGYLMKPRFDYNVTMVAFDAGGNVIGCLPLYMDIHAYALKNELNCFSLAEKDGDDIKYVSSSLHTSWSNRVGNITHTLRDGYDVQQIYYQQMEYINAIEDEPSKIIAAYVGKYTSIQEATTAGAKDIKDALFSSPGYGADYSKGVSFTIFAGEDEANIKETYYCVVQTKLKDLEEPEEDSRAWINFYGVTDGEGNGVRIITSKKDSYSEGKYVTMLVEEDVDLSKLAPRFSVPDTANVYAEGKNGPEIVVSGESYRDFSQGPVQYTVSSQDGKHLDAIWLQIVKVGAGNGKLYINSLGDENAKTKIEDGITYSTREMIIDGRYDYKHDIILINLDTEEIPAISAEIVSDEVELDDYWTLKGDSAFPNIDNGGTETGYYNPWNLAMLRIRPKEGAADGRDIHGTLTIKSNGTELMVLTLTGTVGDPSITTKEIPQAVKYVPYGTMIQSSNKYSWNKVSFEMIDGNLPEGVELQPNGEIYGVPLEIGDFTFTVLMENSYRAFADSERTFTLSVLDNTNDNVDGQTAEGYTLTERIQNMSVNSIYEQTVVSEGVYGEFKYVFLDGVKLEEGVDYTSESGSTRITIRRETLQKNNAPGRHTLGIEFRTEGSEELKPAAQNYEISERKTSSSSGGGRRSSTTTSRNTSSIPRDAKKGYYNTQTGIITGSSDGYSHWVKDDLGWKLIYADNTPAAGQVIQLADGTAAEQVLWEQIDGVWYAFGITGYLKSGWVCDYQLNGWYCMTEYGMYSGWYGDAQDHCVYYLEPGTGKLAAGWKNIDGKWYYFNEVAAVPTWNYNAVTGEWEYNPLAGNKPYGAAYINEQTPDGYFVGIDGVWDGQE